MFAPRFSCLRSDSDSGRRFPALRLAGALLAMLVLTVASLTPALADSKELTEEDALRMRGHVELALPNGNQLSFVPVYNDDDRLLGYGLVQSLAPETAGYLEIRELRSANPAEVFNALTPRGTEMPSQLADHYGRPTLGAQGWALDNNAWQPHHISPCYAPNFEASFPNFTQHHVISYDDGPSNNPDAWDWTLHEGLRTIRPVGKQVSSYYAKVTRCEVGNLQYPGGPDVRVDGVQNGIPFYAFLGELPAWGSSVDFTWHSLTPIPVVSWELNVSWSWPGDEFHIGYAYNAVRFSP